MGTSFQIEIGGFDVSAVTGKDDANNPPDATINRNAFMMSCMIEETVLTSDALSIKNEK